MAETLVARLTVHGDCRLRCAFGVFGSVALPDKLSIASTAMLRARRNGHGHSTRTWLPVRTGYATQPVDLNDSQLSPTTIAAGQPVNLAPTNAHPPLPNAEGEVPLQRLVSRRKLRSRDRDGNATHPRNWVRMHLAPAVWLIDNAVRPEDVTADRRQNETHKEGLQGQPHQILHVRIPCPLSR